MILPYDERIDNAEPQHCEGADAANFTNWLLIWNIWHLNSLFWTLNFNFKHNVQYNQLIPAFFHSQNCRENSDKQTSWNKDELPLQSNKNTKKVGNQPLKYQIQPKTVQESYSLGVTIQYAIPT